MPSSPILLSNPSWITTMKNYSMKCCNSFKLLLKLCEPSNLEKRTKRTNIMMKRIAKANLKKVKKKSTELILSTSPKYSTASSSSLMLMGILYKVSFSSIYCGKCIKLE